VIRRVAARSEDLALLLGALGAAAGIVVGLVLLDRTAPLFGRSSIGEVAATCAALTAGISALTVLLTVGRSTQPWLRTLARWRRALDVLALSLLLTVLAFLTTSVLFAVLFAQAFPEVRLDRYAGAFWVAVAGAVWAYLSASITKGLGAQSLSTLLAVFLVTGALSSALSSANPRWWERNFSTLGAAADASGITFDMTLLIGGFVLIAVGDFVAHELWVSLNGIRESPDPADPAPRGGRPDQVRRRDVRTVTYVRTVLLVFGVLTAAVALIPVSTHKVLHDAAAQGLVVVFALALLTFPVLLRHLPGSLTPITGLALGLLGFELVLYKGVGYLNTTAFEMGATGTVLIWLMLLIRTVAAAADDVRSEQEQLGPSAPPRTERSVRS
jgi:hypothetical protein